MGQITYADKSAINVNPEIADTNKVNAADMNEIKTAVNDNYTKIGNITGTILWTNPNPTSEFSSQNITLNSDDYDLLLWIFKGFNNSNWQGSTHTIKGGNVRLIYMAGTSIWYRNCQYVNDTTYSIYNESTDNNGRNIPLYVIGYKTGLF